MNTALVNVADNNVAMNAPTIGGSLRKNIIGLCFLCLAAYCPANKLQNNCHAREADFVVIQKSNQFLPVMPVPDQVRDDKTATYAVLTIVTHSGRRESSLNPPGFPPAPE